MFDLKHIQGNTYYIDAPVKIGLYRLNDKEVILIDSGNDRDAGRKIKKLLDQNGWSLKAIYNTHSNADHIGGNQYLQNQYHCKIFAPDIESAFSRMPLLEPAFLYGGYPLKDLQHKFLMAKASQVKALSSKDLPEGFELIDLPGHFLDMAGYKTPDNVLFLADCLNDPKILDKYGLSYIFDVEQYLKTIDQVKTCKADYYLPSHSTLSRNIEELARVNKEAVLANAQKIADLAREKSTFEDLLARVFEAFGLTMSLEQYALIGSTLKGYLSFLEKQGQIKAWIEDNHLFYQAGVA